MKEMIQMKESYTTPETEVIEFDCVDIITTSSFSYDNNETEIF